MKDTKTKDILPLCLAFLASAVMLTVIQAPFPAFGGIFRFLPLLAWISLVPFILGTIVTPAKAGVQKSNGEVDSRSLGDKFRGNDIGRIALAAYIVSFFYWLGNLYWIAPITILGWLAFCFYTALHWPILALCLRYCRSKKIPLFLSAGILFVGAERLQGLFLGGFFWRFLAHSQYQNITLIQSADIFGTGGISFLIAMVNGLLAELILDARRTTNSRVGLAPPLSYWRAKAHPTSWKGIFKIRNLIKIAVVCAALIAAIVYGRWRIDQSQQFITEGPLVASLQSNVPQSVKREALRGEGEEAEQTSQQIFDELMEKSEAAVEAGAELIVWPETMVQAVLSPRVLALLDTSHYYKIFDNALSEHSKDTAYVLVGAYGGSPQIKEDGTIYLAQKYNSAFLYQPDGQQSQKCYDKIHLVLFGEVMPFRQSCPFLFDFIMKFNPYGYDHSLDAGGEYTVFEMGGSIADPCHSERLVLRPVRHSFNEGGSLGEGGSEESLPLDSSVPSPGKAETQGVEKHIRIYKFSTVICYEATLPEIVRKFVLDQNGHKQIDWLINISNDGWFVRFEDDKVIPATELAQHAAICVFRAVENRLPVLRSVNTGISCLIDSTGRIRDGYVAANADFPVSAMQRKGIAGWFTDKMPIDKRVTFFSKYGQWLDFCCAFCLILLIMVQFSGKLLKDQKHPARLSGKINGKHTQKN